MSFRCAEEKFNGIMKLHQDNDSKHSSKLCVKSLQDLNINLGKHLTLQKYHLNDIMSL